MKLQAWLKCINKFTTYMRPADVVLCLRLRGCPDDNYIVFTTIRPRILAPFYVVTYHIILVKEFLNRR